MSVPERYQATVSPREIHRAILRALTRHAREQARHLDISACAGEVMIAGDVCSDLDREVLLEAARQVPGVTRVQNLVAVHDRAAPAKPRAR